MRFTPNTGCLILLATPKFSYVPESRKKQSPELATPKKWQNPGLATPKKWQSPQLLQLQPARKFLDSVVSKNLLF